MLNNSLQNNGEKSAVNIHKRPTNEPTSCQRHCRVYVSSIMSQTPKHEIDNVIQTTFNWLIYDNDCFPTVFDTKPFALTFAECA